MTLWSYTYCSARESWHAQTWTEGDGYQCTLGSVFIIHKYWSVKYQICGFTIIQPTASTNMCFWCTVCCTNKEFSLDTIKLLFMWCLSFNNSWVNFRSKNQLFCTSSLKHHNMASLSYTAEFKTQHSLLTANLLFRLTDHLDCKVTFGGK